MVMAEGDIPYELREVDILQNEHRSAGFLKINPAGLVPAMITPRGDCLYETPAINLYLAEQHGLTHLAPQVHEAERGTFLSGLFFITDELEPVMKRYFYPHCFAMREEDAPVVRQRSLDTAIDRLNIIERRLKTAGPYHLGNRFSLVDLTLAYWAACLESADVLDSFTAIRRCTQEVKNRPKLGAWFDEIRVTSQEYKQMRVRSEEIT